MFSIRLATALKGLLRVPTDKKMPWTNILDALVAISQLFIPRIGFVDIVDILRQDDRFSTKTTQSRRTLSVPSNVNTNIQPVFESWCRYNRCRVGSRDYRRHQNRLIRFLDFHVKFSQSIPDVSLWLQRGSMEIHNIISRYAFLRSHTGCPGLYKYWEDMYKKTGAVISRRQEINSQTPNGKLHGDFALYELNKVYVFCLLMVIIIRINDMKGRPNDDDDAVGHYVRIGSHLVDLGKSFRFCQWRYGYYRDRMMSELFRHIHSI